MAPDDAPEQEAVPPPPTAAPAAAAAAPSTEQLTLPRPAPASERPLTARPARPAERPARAPAGELLSAVSALLLLILTFATKWYGVDGLPRGADRSGIETGASAWNELADVRWAILLTVLVTLGSVAIHVTQRSHGSQTDTSRVITLVGGITAALLVYRVLITLPSPGSVVDAKIGADLGVLACVGVALGGFESLRAQRLARRRIIHRPPRRPAVAPREQAR
jgi:hypothetical protein